MRFAEGIAVVASVALLLGTGCGDAGKGQRRKSAQGATDMLRGAVARYHKDTGQYPTEEQGLAALLQHPMVTGWNGPYLQEGQIPRDPWGGVFRYRLADGKPQVQSPGPDGKYDTADDLRVPLP